MPLALWEAHGNESPEPFPFLQGDVVRTSDVVPPAGVALPDVSLWQVLARDCDTYKAPWLRVAPVYSVDGRLAADPATDRASLFKQALLLRSPHRFPIPPFEGDPERGVRGHFADFTVPCHVAQARARGAIQVASLTETGWLLFCAVLVASASRLENLGESVALRCLPAVPD